MNEGEGIKVGDKVTVFGKPDDYITIRTVVKATKTRFTDDKGTHWLKSWMKPVGTSIWDHTRCKPYSAEHDVEIQQRKSEVYQKRTRNYLTTLDWRDLPWEVVEKVYQTVKEAQ